MNLEKELKEILIDKEQIEKRVKELGAQITEDYKRLLGNLVNEKPLIAICLLRGAIIFLADLIREIKIPLEYDFISVSSYKDSSRPGEIELLKDLEVSIEGRDVLIVEDIVDTGHTLNYIKENLLSRSPASLKICSLIDKTARREVKVDIDYVGFTVEKDEFLVGYGLDYAGRYRNLPYIAALKSEMLERSESKT